MAGFNQLANTSRVVSTGTAIYAGAYGTAFFGPMAGAAAANLANTLRAGMTIGGYVLTQHAVEQAEERGVTLSEIEEAVEGLVLGRHAEPYNDKPRIYPIDLGETGTWRDSIDVALPADYVVDDLPAAVDLDVGFARYKSDVQANGNVLHYSREYVVRGLDLAPEKSADVSKLMAVIAADENSSAVLKKK
jgi:hypothetical protein